MTAEPEMLSRIHPSAWLASALVRFRRLGIQRRIMLYVTVGLGVIFGLLIFIGLRSINESTSLVFEERLSTARTTAVLLDRDLLHVSADVREFSGTFSSSQDPTESEQAAAALLSHVTDTDSFAFFHAIGIWVVDGAHNVTTTAGIPKPGTASERTPLGVLANIEYGYQILPPMASLPDESNEISFATVATRLRPESDDSGWVIVHLASDNSSSPYVPATAEASETAEIGDKDSANFYHLEVISPGGTVVLGIGDDENPGSQSPHFSAISSIIAQRKSAALRHDPAAGDAFEAHVMGVVPLGDSGFAVVLEQPIDVALALPLRLRRQLITWSAIGFGVALLIAWVTTRSVAKPTIALTGAAKRMASGDLDVPIDVAAQDEIGTLAESLESMRRQTRAAYEAAEEANAQLESRVRERTERLGELIGKIITAQEDERHRLARELHDETAQTIGALSIALDRARDSVSGNPDTAIELLLDAKRITAHLLEDTRRLILDLRPMVLDDLGLAPAIRWYAESRLEGAGIVASIDTGDAVNRLSTHLETSLFRIAQEAINNVARHSGARSATVKLMFSDSTAGVTVTDDGCGFDVDAMIHGKGRDGSVGLLGIQERVSLLQGQLRLHSALGRGTSLAVELPLDSEMG